MKKTLVAVAALVATGAFADVTISGHYEQGFLTQTTAGDSPAKTTGLAPILGPNIIVFSGSEDLGSGMKASFKMDSKFQAAGLNAARESWVALGGAFGTVTLGQQYSSMFWNTLATDPNGFNNLAGVTVAGDLASSSWGPGQVMLSGAGAALVGSADTITYALPTFVEGVAVSVQSIRPSATTSGTSALVSYSNGGLYAGYTIRNVEDDKASSIAASYDFGVAKIGFSNIDATTSGAKMTDNTFTISAPIGSSTSLGFSTGMLTRGTDEYNNMQAGAYYNLSKRTSLYGVYGKSSIGSTSVTSTAVGVAHNF